MLVWPLVLVGVLLLLFGAAWSYLSRTRNATDPMERRVGPIQSLFPGVGFAVAGVVILVVAAVRADVRYVSRAGQ